MSKIKQTLLRLLILSLTIIKLLETAGLSFSLITVFLKMKRKLLIFIGVSGSLLISQATFLQNTATNFGGGIYIGDQSITVDSSSFIENSALEGGAIATMASDSTIVVGLTESTFTSNNASQGAALIALGIMNYDYSTSTFQTNTAQYGGVLASIPTSLRLKIYYVEPFFLYLDSVTRKDLLSSSSTVKIIF